jgi:hypothetical protein
LKPRRASNAHADAGRHKRHRRARRAAIGAVFLLALVALFTLTPLAGVWLRPLIGPRLTGVRLEGGSMRFTLGGDLVVTGAEVFIEPGPVSRLRGEAARFLRIERVRIGLALMAPFTGKDFIHDVSVSDADILVAKPVDGYDINLLEIFSAARPGDGPLRAPGVDVRRATLTLGEYDEFGDVTPLRTMRVTAGVRREGQSRYSIWLRELDEGPSADVSVPAQFEGAIDGATPGANTFSGTLAGIDLADWPAEAIPLQLRSDYIRFAPVGGLHKASFVYDEKAGAFRLSLDITRDGADSGAPVRFTMPLGSREDDDPDMIVPVEAGGRVRITWRDADATWPQAGAPEAPGPGDHRWNLSADLHGALLGAPASVDIDYWFGATEEKAYYEVEAASDAPLPLDPERWAGRVPEQILDEVRRFQIDGAGDLWLRAARTATTPEFVEAGLHIRETRAIYRHFRYPIEDASGDIIFRDGAVRIAIDGHTPSGAPVTVRGEVGIGDTITMDTTLTARGVSYDQTMIDALNDRSTRIIELMLYEDGLDDWLASGLLEEPFAIGGTADLNLRLTLDTAESTEVGAVMDIRADRIGLRNRHFPLPAVGTGVHVRAVKELQHTLPDGTERPESLVIRPVSGEFTTLAGGSLDPFNTVIRIPTAHVERLEADVRVEAADVAICDLLIASIPGDDPFPEAEAADPDHPDLDGRSIARRLRPEGKVNAIATIRRRPGGPTAVRVGVEVDGAVHPPPIEGAGPLVIGDLTGSVNITREDVQVDLRGRPDGDGWMAAKVNVPIGDPQHLIVRAEALAVDSARPLENLVNVFRPAEARRLAEFKAEADPAGLFDVAMTLGAPREGAPGADPAPMRIEITNLIEPQMNLLGGRISARRLDGRLILDQADPGVITIDGVEGAFNFDGTPLGRLTVSGARALEPGRHALVRVDFDDARIESPLLARQIERVGGEAAGWQWREAEPAGLASGWIAFGTSVTEAGPAAAVSAVHIVPHTLSWTRNGARAEPERIAGVIIGDAADGALAGTVHDLELTAGRYAVTASGPWSLSEGRGLGATLALRGHLDPPELPQPSAPPDAIAPAPSPSADRDDAIPPGVRAALPAPALEAIQALALSTRGRVTLSDATWRFRGGATAEDAPLFEGRLHLNNATGGLDQQIHVSEVEAWITVQPAPESDPAGDLPRVGAIPEIMIAEEPLGAMEALIRFDEGVLWGLPVTSGRAVIASDVPGIVRAPMISADSAAGGRITAHGEARRRDEQWTYQANLVSSALPVSAISRAIRSVISGTTPPPQLVVTAHGVLDLGMGIEGVFGDVRARRGEGSLRISGGSPVNLPPALRLLVSTANARLASAPYDHVEADFFFEGDLVAFPSISMSSRDIVIMGYGFMSLVDGAVELVARSEPRGRQIGGGEVFRGVRDLFFTTYVGGTIDDPQALNLPPRDRLPAPFSQLLRHLQGGLTEREWLMRQLRQHAASEPDPRHRR